MCGLLHLTDRLAWFGAMFLKESDARTFRIFGQNLEPGYASCDLCELFHGSFHLGQEP